jgi:hypothetical protein
LCPSKNYYLLGELLIRGFCQRIICFGVKWFFTVPCGVLEVVGMMKWLIIFSWIAIFFGGLWHYVLCWLRICFVHPTVFVCMYYDSMVHIYSGRKFVIVFKWSGLLVSVSIGRSVTQRFLQQRFNFGGVTWLHQASFLFSFPVVVENS